MRGIRTSIRIRSGFTWGAMETASSPLVATSTSCPANRRVKATKSRISRSSSAIKIFAIESSLFFVNWQSEGKDATITHHTRALHPNTTFVHFHNLFNDGKTQSSSWRSQHQWMLASVEPLEDPVLIFQGNTHTIVGHIHLHLMATIRRMNSHRDCPVLRCIVISIIHKIAKNLTHTLDIAVDMRKFFRRIQGKCHGPILFLRAPQNISDDIFGNFTQIKCLRGQRHASRFDARDIQKIIDQDIESFCVVLNNIQKVHLILIHCARRAHEKNIHVPTNGGHRRAKLMANRCNKLRLQPIHFDLMGNVPEDGYCTQEIVLQYDRREMYQDNTTVLQV